MEAASARYAARDRFGAFAEPAQSQLQRYIQNAVDPQNFEPNLALDLEIADLINSKKGNAPREAAVAIVNFVNHRNPNVSLLALTLLDICVKNCGYAFHLQISTKEFLNELVRRFPERPPVRPSRVQLRILEAIEEWRQTICQTSKYKEDLGFIRDMHRLLSYKGYVFPEIRREDAAVLNPSDSLKSAEEMEEEERDAQSAKLQELIRRGGPEDLREANRLMKIMAGYDTKNKTDYRAKAAEEVSRVQQKAKLLEERLQSFKPGDTMTDGDVFSELASSLQSAHPKIQKMCEEESDDHEAVAKLLEINDSIHRTIERYKLMKSGDVAAAQRIPHGTLGTSTGVSKNAKNELSLIDFGGDDTPAETTSTTTKQSSAEDDLLGLSLSDTTYGQSGGIALGFGANANVPGPALLSSIMQQSSARSPTPNSTTIPQAGPIQPNYNALAGLNVTNDSISSSNSSFANTQSVTPLPAKLPSQQQQAAKQPPSDPFGILSNSVQSVPNPLYNPASQMKQSTPASKPANGAHTADDDWNFSSALPDEPPAKAMITVCQKEIGIVFQVSRRATDETVVEILARFSNRTAKPVTELTFQVAVTKSFQLKLTPQSGRKLAAMQADGITQPIEIYSVQKGQAESVKIRWRISYKAAGEPKQDQGEVPPLGIL